MKLHEPFRRVQFQVFEKLTIERERPYDYLLIIQTWKNSRGKSAGRCFLKPFFSQSRKPFFKVSVQNFCHCFTISLAYKTSHCLSVNHNLELRCVICTGFTLFAPVLHFLHWCYTWAALLSANQNRVWIFSCVLLWPKTTFNITQQQRKTYSLAGNNFLEGLVQEGYYFY